MRPPQEEPREKAFFQVTGERAQKRPAGSLGTEKGFLPGSVEPIVAFGCSRKV